MNYENMKKQRMDELFILFKSGLNVNRFQVASKLSLLVAQVLGFFPVQLNGTNYKSVRFKWLYWKTIYSSLTLILLTLQTIIVLYTEFQYEIRLISMNGIIFAINVVTQTVCFYKLAYRWEDFLKEWHNLEMRMNNYQILGNLKRHLSCITFAVIALGFVEHFLINVHHISTCFLHQETLLDGLRIYYSEKAYPAIFKVIQYSLWKGLLLQYISLQGAFIWNYADVFIMITGESLKFRLRQITYRIMLLVKVKGMDKTTWHTLRKDYLLFSTLHMKVNDQIAGMLVFTFCTNLYFILLQMFNTLRNMEYAFLKSYNLTSFCLILIRITAIIIFGSGVNEEWRKIRCLLDSVPHWAYNVEVERFIETVESKELVLTGMNFFSIRRGLILHIAATIVTYELVLLQYYRDILKANT